MNLIYYISNQTEQLDLASVLLLVKRLIPNEEVDFIEYIFFIDGTQKQDIEHIINLDILRSQLTQKIIIYKNDPYSPYKQLYKYCSEDKLIFISENFNRDLSDVLEKLKKQGVKNEQFLGIAHNLYSQKSFRYIKDYKTFEKLFRLSHSSNKANIITDPTKLLPSISKQNNSSFTTARYYSKNLLIVISQEDCIAKLIKEDFEENYNAKFLVYDDIKSTEELPKAKNNIFISNIDQRGNSELKYLRNFLYEKDHISQKIILHSKNFEYLSGFEHEIKENSIFIKDFSKFANKSKIDILLNMHSYLFSKDYDYKISTDLEPILSDCTFYETIYEFLKEVGPQVDFGLSFWYHLTKKVESYNLGLSKEQQLLRTRSRDNYIIQRTKNEWELRIDGLAPFFVEHKKGLLYLAEILKSEETDPNIIYNKCNPGKQSKDAFTTLRKSTQQDLKSIFVEQGDSRHKKFYNHFFMESVGFLYFNDSEKKIDRRDNYTHKWHVLV